MKKPVVTDELVVWTAELQERIHRECRSVKDLPVVTVLQANVMLSALTFEIVALCRAMDLSDTIAVKGIRDCFAKTPRAASTTAREN